MKVRAGPGDEGDGLMWVMWVMWVMWRQMSPGPSIMDGMPKPEWTSPHAHAHAGAIKSARIRSHGQQQ